MMVPTLALNCRLEWTLPTRQSLNVQKKPALIHFEENKEGRSYPPHPASQDGDSGLALLASP